MYACTAPHTRYGMYSSSFMREASETHISHTVGYYRLNEEQKTKAKKNVMFQSDVKGRQLLTQPTDTRLSTACVPLPRTASFRRQSLLILIFPQNIFAKDN